MSLFSRNKPKERKTSEERFQETQRLVNDSELVAQTKRLEQLVKEISKKEQKA